MQTNGEAVQQSLTAVWREMRHLRECGKRGNDLEEVERVWAWFDRLRGRRLLGWVPQVSLRATQRLAFVGRFHRPVYQCVRPVRDRRTTEKGDPKAALLTFVVNYS